MVASADSKMDYSRMGCLVRLEPKHPMVKVSVRRLGDSDRLACLVLMQRHSR